MSLLMLGRAIASALVLAAASGATTMAADGAPSIVGDDVLAVDVSSGTGTILLVAVNPTTGDIGLTWAIALASSDGGALVSPSVSPATTSLAPGSSVVVLTVSRPDATGRIDGVLTGSAGGLVVLTHKVSVVNLGAALPLSPLSIIAAATVLAGLLIWARYNKLTDRDKPLANPKWDFTTSWASTFSGVGAVLTTILSAGALPEDRYLLDKTAFAGLSVFFAFLALAAPVVYLALRDLTDPETPSGTVKVFHLATWLTTTAVVGQLVTMVLVVVDALGQDGWSSLVVALLAIGVAALVLTLAYVWRTIPITVAQGQRVGTTAAPARHDWSLL